MKIHNVFWTGGFDSTYRIAEILKKNEGIVRPIYIVDRDRFSLQEELSAMAVIRSALISRFDCREAFSPVEMYLKDDFLPSREIVDAYNEISIKVHFGTQYKWLAQLAEHMKYKYGKIEIGNERHEPSSDWQFEVFDDPRKRYPALKNKSCVLKLFGNCTFPVLHLTKEDMCSHADDMGFLDILEFTWFCHSPVCGLPCGGCNPCRIARLARTNIKYAFLGRERRLVSAGFNKLKKYMR